MDKETVRRVAMLARLELSEEEIESFTKDLGEILEHFSMLDELQDLDDYGFNPVEVIDVLRDDEPHQEIPAEELLRDMDTYEDYVRGPRLS